MLSTSIDIACERSKLRIFVRSFKINIFIFCRFWCLNKNFKRYKKKLILLTPWKYFNVPPEHPKKSNGIENGTCIIIFASRCNTFDIITVKEHTTTQLFLFQSIFSVMSQIVELPSLTITLFSTRHRSIQQISSFHVTWEQPECIVFIIRRLKDNDNYTYKTLPLELKSVSMAEISNVFCKLRKNLCKLFKNSEFMQISNDVNDFDYYSGFTH